MNWIRDHFKLVAEGHDEPVGRLDRMDGVGLAEDDGTVSESLAAVERPRGAA